MREAKFIPPLLKMRQRNNAEEKFMLKKMVEIESGYRQTNRKLITEIAELQTTLIELNRDGGDHCLDYFDAPEKKPKEDLNSTLPDDSVDSNLVKRDDKVDVFEINGRSSVPASSDTCRRNVKSLFTPCIFGLGVKNIACQHFPCATPRGYNSIGFQISNRPYPKGLACPAAEPKACDAAPNHGEARANTDLHDGTNVASTVKPRKSTVEFEHLPKLATRAKVLALKHILEKRKRKLAETKPKSWVTNYGERVPLRRLQNPLRPVPTEGED